MVRRSSVSARTMENGEAARHSSNGHRPPAWPASRTTDTSEGNSAAVDGALPGATSGVVAGFLGGIMSGSNTGVAISLALAGMGLGMVIGVVLGGLAGVYSQRIRRRSMWRHWPAPMLLGAIVGLSAFALFSEVWALPWGGLTGMAAASVWPLLGKLTQEQPRIARDPLVGDRKERVAAPRDGTRHYIDPKDLNDAEYLSRRRISH